MFKEFKEFIVKGNAFDLAVSVIIGGDVRRPGRLVRPPTS